MVVACDAFHIIYICVRLCDLRCCVVFVLFYWCLLVGPPPPTIEEIQAALVHEFGSFARDSKHGLVFTSLELANNLILVKLPQHLELIEKDKSALPSYLDTKSENRIAFDNSIVNPLKQLDADLSAGSLKSQILQLLTLPNYDETTKNLFVSGALMLHVVRTTLHQLQILLPAPNTNLQVT